jgi:hypothetical protein
MEKYYTNGYKLVNEIYGTRINMDSHGRWLCYLNVEKAGSRFEEITLYDNYCERYTIKYDISTKTFIDLSGNSLIDIGLITLKSKTINRYPLPDFSIDVMQTFSCPIAFETLRRQAEIISKNYLAEAKAKTEGLFMPCL